MLEMGWIDFSDEHRKKVMHVLEMLTKPGALDELGIAVIRDRFADIFFPGTSTIQTRAKYFLIIPWLMNELEKEKGLNPVQFARKLHDEEIKLIYVLEKDGESGVIGRDSREKLKRKPSDIYWNGLRTYGFFKYPKLTLAEYLNAACKMRDKNEQKKNELFESEDSKDDKDAFGSEIMGTFWSLIKPKDDWKETVEMKLSFDEAKFIKEKITTSPFSKDLLWAQIIKNFGPEAAQLSYFEDLEDIIKLMPKNIYDDYIMAKDFSNLIFGAHIRYNVLFFDAAGIDSDALTLWYEWKNYMKNEFDFSRWNQEELFARVKVYDPRLRGFIRNWTEFSKDINSNESKIDELIINREIALKGIERSKIKNADEFTNNAGNWIGIGKLQYRWPNAKRLLQDILEGLGDMNV